MVFSNLVFLFLFLPILLLIYFISPIKIRNYILLVASLFFYAWGEPKYVVLMMLSILVNYTFGLLINRYDKQKKKRKIILWLSLLVNLAILVFYKYANFLVENVNSVLGTQINLEPIALPIGISFFTFQAMSYVIDVYRKEADVQKNFFDLSLYISLFPQLVAGPIVRYKTVADEIKSRIVTSNLFATGLQRFIIGLSKKVLIANPLGALADSIFVQNPSDMSLMTAWIGIVAYALQIYFDFSGYSDMAIGLGKMFGFNFLENFNYPYIARSVTDFWRRWHMSLGSWFRDYVYIPLGGNRVGKLKFLRNILIVWGLTGIWHGASWTFLVWGLYFGLILTLEKMFLGKLIAKMWIPVQHAYLLLIVLISWVFFRADSFSYSISFIQTMFGFNGKNLMDNAALLMLNDNMIFLIVGIVLSAPVFKVFKEKTDCLLERGNKFISIPISTIQVAYYMILLLAVTICLINSTYNPFIYFRF